MLLLQVINGQLYAHTTAWIIFVTYALWVCMNTYIATMRHNHALANGQPKAAARSAPVAFFGGVEALKYFFSLFLRNSCALVANGDNYFAILFGALNIDTGIRW